MRSGARVRICGGRSRRPQPVGLIFHSDRGTQYASEDFRAVIEKHGMRASMSRKGNCWDNAVKAWKNDETVFPPFPATDFHILSATITTR
jgi:transposase InsO family protein